MIPLDDAHPTGHAPADAGRAVSRRRRRHVAFAVVLAGGTGRRMGGASKPDVTVAGRRMLDHVLGELAAQGVPAVVVGPPDLDVPDGVALTREDPPFGGPAAGIAAGYRAGTPLHGPGPVAVLACDAPFAPRVLPELAAAAATAAADTTTAADASAGASAPPPAGRPADRPDGAMARTPDGRDQRLLCVIDSGALGAAIAGLDAAGGVRDRSVRALFDGLRLARVDVPGWVADADSPADVAELERIAATVPPSGIAGDD